MNYFLSKFPARAHVLLIILGLASLTAQAQNEVAIGSATTKSNAILWLNGNGSQGLILPTVTNKSAVNNPDQGMIVYDNSDSKVWYRNNSAWVEVGGGSSSPTTLNLQLSGNQLQLRDGTSVLNSVNLAGGTQTAGAFLVFQGGTWQFATLSGDVTGANGALQVTGLRGKTIATLPASTQALVYDPAANSGAGGFVFQAFTGGGGITSVSGTAPITVTNPTTTPGISLANAGITNALLADNAVTSAKIADGTITGADIANTTISADKLSQSSATPGQVLKWNGTAWAPQNDDTGVGTTPTLSNGQLLIGNGTTNSAETLSGDATLSGGTFTISNGAVTSAKIADGTITAADVANVSLTADKLAQSGASANQVLQWNGTNWVPVTLAGGGSVTNIATGAGLSGGPITTTGTISIAAGGVGNTELANDAVTSAKIADATITGADIANTTITSNKLAQSAATPGQVLKWNGTNWLPSADDVGGGATPTLNTGQILIGDGTNNAAAALSGDATLAGGVLTIANNAITTAKINASAVDATKLADNAVTSAKIADATVTGADIANTTITANKLAQSGALNNQILQWNGTNWIPVTIPGASIDLTAQTGVLLGNGSTITGSTAGDGVRGILGSNNNTIGWVTGTLNQVLGTNASGDLQFTDKSNFTSSTLSSGQVLVGNASNVATGVAMSGDATLSNTGTLTIANNAINSAKIADGSIVDADVNAAAAIAGTKINPNFGSQNINTTGQVNSTSGIFGTSLLQFGANAEFGGRINIINPAQTNRVFVGESGSNYVELSWNTADDYGQVFTNNGPLVLNTGVENVGIGTTTPAAKLDILGNIKITDGTQAAGSVLTSDANGVATWQPAGGSGWGLTGNEETVDGTNFIGTTDNIPFNIRVNNQKAGRIDPTLNNAFYGYLSGNSNTTGFVNTAYGSNALTANTTGDSNTANGAFALNSNTTGGGNTAIGRDALRSNTIGIGNTSTGVSALVLNTTGNSNSANGYQALLSNTTGSNNTANGAAALFSNTTGFQNTGIGVAALLSNSVGTDNTAVGFQALNFSTGSGNTANGSFAMANTTTGNNNTSTGFLSMVSNTAGFNNSALGYNALAGNTSGRANTSIGFQSMPNNTTGFDNTAIGAAALFLNITGTENTSIGFQSLRDNTGSRNSGLGYNALISNTTGTDNTAIGFWANVASGALTNATAIGANSIVDASNRMVLGAPGTAIQFNGELRPNNLPGTAGQVLTSQGPGATPTWANAGGGGFSTLNTIPKGDGTGLAASQIFDNGTFVGIGTNTPSNFLHVAGDVGGASTIATLEGHSATTTRGPGISLLRSKGTVAAPVAVVDGDYLGGFSVSGRTASAYNLSSAIQFNVDGAVAGTSVPGRIIFSTTLVGNSTTTERMRITNAGNVGIGTTTPTSRLDISGNTLLRGTNSNTPPTVSSGVELMTGRAFGGTLIAGQASADIAFNWGGASGGFRHFIQTRHNSVANSNSNSIDFFVNNSTTAAGSLTPNNTIPNGNVLAMSMTAVGIGINRSTPNAALQFANVLGNRRLVLWESANNDHEFYGFGVNGGEFRYQIPNNSGAQHRFYAATSATTSLLQMTIGQNGNVAIAGTLSKGSGTFKIDHPLDPKNKFLYHSFVESPEMMNVYNGNTETDSQGNSTITLPTYFEALNKDFRYQLTVIGQFAQAIVMEEINDNKFVIKTDKPNVKVSWQVTGVRKDPFAEKNRVVAEVEKSAEDKGNYLHPEAYGLPIEKKIGYENNELKHQ